MPQLQLVLLAVGFFPFVATRWTLLHWMEQRMGFRQIAIHVALLLLWLLIPLSPLFWTLATMFRLDRSTQTQLQSIIDRWPSLHRETIETTRLSFKPFQLYELDKAKSTGPSRLVN